MKLTTGWIIGLAFTLAACAAVPTHSPIAMTNNPAAARAASPASLNCIQNNGTLEIVQTPEGEKGYCLLPGSKRCDEWEMFRGNCPIRTVNANMNFLGF
jgi:hypothetical protein